MKKKAIILFLGAICLTGCSLFEKADNEELSSLIGGLSGETSTESTGTPSEVMLGEGVELIDETGSEDLVENTLDTEEDSPRAEITDTEMADTPAQQVFRVNETSEISFKSETMQTPVIVKLTANNLVRGVDAQYVIDLYNADNPEQPIAMSSNPDLEFCVLNYTVDLGTTEGIQECSTEVMCKIGGANSADSISHEGKLYNDFPVLYNPSGDKVSSGLIGNGQFIFMLPVGCNDFSVTLGDPSVLAATYVFK